MQFIHIMSSHVEYIRFRRPDACTEEGCRAKKYYIESGKKYCSRGHEQEVSPPYLTHTQTNIFRASHKPNKTKMTGTLKAKSRARSERKRRNLRPSSAEAKHENSISNAISSFCGSNVIGLLLLRAFLRNWRLW